MKTWIKSGNEVIAQGEVALQRFTREELEEGLRVLNEKPIFEAQDKQGNWFVFQKRNGVLMYNNHPTKGKFRGVFIPVGGSFNIFNSLFGVEIFQAIINARDS